MKRFSSTVLMGLALIACGSDDPAGSTHDDEAGDLELTTFAEQVELGGMLFGEHCAGCHGDAGQGDAAVPALVGLEQGALPLEPRPYAVRTTRFETVADVASFVVANMPADAPGSLSEQEYWALLAFDLSANGLELDQKLTPEFAASLTIPR